MLASSVLTHMNVKSILVLFGSGLYFFVCHYWYCCNVKAACYGCATPVTEMAATMTTVSAPPPLSFNWSMVTPVISAGFEEKKEEWLEGKLEDNVLEITGKYALEEDQPEDFSNMGLARADAIRKILAVDLPDGRIRLNSEEIEKNTPEERLEGISVKWIPAGENDSAVLDFGDKAILFYPFDVNDKISKATLEEYLSAVANSVRESGKVIFLTGHTDTQGTIKKNLRVAKNRAMRIRRILRQKGVDREQIVVNSKGEQEPIASNDTEMGRYQNRRVVLELK